MTERILIRDEIREWERKDRELAVEIQDLQADLRSYRNQRTNAEFQIVEKMVKEQMYWLVKVDKTAVRKFMANEFSDGEHSF
jgi:uncharacterized protein YlxW (UPF0749 family)